MDRLGDPRSGNYIARRISIRIQRRNFVSVLDTLLRGGSFHLINVALDLVFAISFNVFVSLYVTIYQTKLITFVTRY